MNIRIGMGKVQIKYNNGYTLLIANGFGSYTENGDAVEKEWHIIKRRDITASWTSEDVEIAVISSDGILITNKVIKEVEDTVAKVSVKRLIEIMNKLMVEEENQC